MIGSLNFLEELIVINSTKILSGAKKKSEGTLVEVVFLCLSATNLQRIVSADCCSVGSRRINKNLKQYLFDVTWKINITIYPTKMWKQLQFGVTSKFTYLLASDVLL